MNPINSVLYKKKWPLIVFLTPALIFMTIFLFYPFIVNIYTSFFNVPQLGAPIAEFNNFENYKMLFTDPRMREALKNTLLIMLFAIVFQVGIALLLAILVDYITKFANFYRIVYFFPIVISATAIGLMFYLFYMKDGGALNQIRGIFGAKPFYWLSKRTAIYMVILPVIWQYVGFYFVILLTGLNNVSEEVYEAAEIDGASKLQSIWYITLPLIKTVLTTCIVLSVTGALKVFDIPYTIIANGGQGTFFTGTYMYYITFMKQNVDYGSTIAVLIVILGVISAGILNFVLKERSAE